MEVYIDDMLVKSLKAKDHMEHLTDCFELIIKYCMRLNAKKCLSAIASGRFLGVVVTARGIKASPEQLKSFINMPEPRTKRDIQRLTGRITALNRFVPRSTDKCKPFFNLLKGNTPFTWNDECHTTFEQLKDYLTNPPLLAKPIDKEPLMLYLAVSETALSAALARTDGKVEQPVYFVSKALEDAETRYPTIQKLAFSLVIAARKLRLYFQCHPITVMTTYPLPKGTT